MTPLFEKFDTEFSPELRALMGEWLTFAAFHFPYDYFNDVEEKALSFREFFEQGAISFDLGCMFNNWDSFFGEKQTSVSQLLGDYEIYGRTEIPRYHVKPIVGYDDVKPRFLERQGVINRPISPYFASFMSDRVKSEEEGFRADPGCKPLLDGFLQGGFVKRRGQLYYWTGKIRPLFEVSHTWKPVGYISPEEKLVHSFSKEYLRDLDQHVKAGGFRGGMEFLRQRDDVQKNHFVREAHKASPMRILSTIYPAKNSGKKKIPTLRWFGEEPKQNSKRLFS